MNKFEIQSEIDNVTLELRSLMDEVKVENKDTTTDVKSGPFKGKVKVNTQTNEDTVELDEVVE